MQQAQRFAIKYVALINSLTNKLVAIMYNSKIYINELFIIPLAVTTSSKELQKRNIKASNIRILVQIVHKLDLKKLKIFRRL